MVPLPCITLRCATFLGVTIARDVARTQQTVWELDHKMYEYSKLYLRADVAKWQTQRT